jgi:hypothetical protein
MINLIIRVRDSSVSHAIALRTAISDIYGPSVPNSQQVDSAISDTTDFVGADIRP